MVSVEDVIAYAAGSSKALDEWDEDEIQSALDAEASQQNLRCSVPDIYPPDLAEALKRRVAVNLASRSRLFPSDLLGDAEVGLNYVPGNDPVVKRLEAPYRRVRLGL